jgi:tRNA (guanosine-2'-O-)-methyltransferase
MNLTEHIALVFGNEHDGVSDAFRQLADGNFMIPQVGIIQSLNISVACAVTIYEAYRQKTLAGHYEVGRSNSQSGYSDTANAWGLT